MRTPNSTDPYFESGEYIVCKSGTSISLDAVAASGWQFDEWSGAVSGTENPVNLVVDTGKDVMATFTGSSYTEWLTQYPALGSSTSFADDFDSDGMNNLVEYALGGNPTVSDAGGVLSASNLYTNGGTNWMVYVYSRRDDAATRGLSYAVVAGTSLLQPMTNSTEEVGSSTPVNGFQTVTNRVRSDIEITQFMKLKIEFTN